MKYFFDNLFEIKNQILKSSSIVLIIDFDGTLSPIVSIPEGAIFPEITKFLLGEISKRINVVIVSGRSLVDIKGRVGLPRLIYAGNHGLEWQTAQRYDCIKIPSKISGLLSEINDNLKKILSEYPGAIIENKKFSIAVNYRSISKLHLKDFKVAVKGIKRGSIELIDDKKTFEFRANLKWNKGEFTNLFLKKILADKKHILPIYIGDSKTDEDAFKVLPFGITVRVGNKKKSFAKYYIKNQKQIKKLLKYILTYE
jgi:trehalose-phosphatase